MMDILLSAKQLESITDYDHTFMISKSLQGPLFDLIHPPSFEQEHVPPRKYGNWLFKKKLIKFRKITKLI